MRERSLLALLAVRTAWKQSGGLPAAGSAGVRHQHRRYPAFRDTGAECGARGRWGLAANGGRREASGRTCSVLSP